jgi:hypothetical protein
MSAPNFGGSQRVKVDEDHISIEDYLASAPKIPVVH